MVLSALLSRWMLPLAVVGGSLAGSEGVRVDSAAMKSFGHSIKNGHLAANTDIPLFEHECTSPPCTITQIHCPTAGPNGWYDAEVSLFIDNDLPLTFTLLELANIGDPQGLKPPPPSPPAIRPNLTEYYLGHEGASCAETCTANGLTCDPAVNTGYAFDQGKAMQQYLSKFNRSILDCKMNPAPWAAPDQPGFVCGQDPHGKTNECIGWNGIPAVDGCDGKYPEQCRVCHCVAQGLGGHGAPAAAPAPPGYSDQGPWGEALFGHTAKNGGVYSTIRIPFRSKFRATLRSKVSGTFWFIIRGVEQYPVHLGDLQLPDSARLRLHRFQNHTDTYDFVTLADVPTGTAGALLNVRFDAAGPKYTYLEACMRALIDGATTPLFLSSGAEDYFLSAYYFNEGEFKTPNSGLTYFDGHGSLSAYKVHDRDPVLFNDGLKLVFRNMESTTGCGDLEHCPNQFCAGNATAVDLDASAVDGWQSPRNKVGSSPAEYKTLVWTYEWPKADEKVASVGAEAAEAARFIVRLGIDGLLTEAAEADLLRRLSRGDAALTATILTYTSAGEGVRARAAKVLSRI